MQKDLCEKVEVEEVEERGPGVCHCFLYLTYQRTWILS